MSDLPPPEVRHTIEAGRIDDSIIVAAETQPLDGTLPGDDACVAVASGALVGMYQLSDYTDQEEFLRAVIRDYKDRRRGSVFDNRLVQEDLDNA